MVDSSKEKILEDDPGNPAFADYADLLRREGDLTRAIEMCLRGLSHNPSHDLGRLVLARLFYERGWTPFAIREVEELCRRHPSNAGLTRLIKAIRPEGELPEAAVAQAAPGSSEETIAEADFDFEELDLIEEDKKDRSG